MEDHFTASITRNNPDQPENIKRRAERIKIYDALAVGSIIQNSSGNYN